MDDADLLAVGREVIAAEREALDAVGAGLGPSFARTVRAILEQRGRIVVTGMGKSGAIARKSAATLASTGTPALFLHPAEAVHGDLGMVARGDLVMALSFSGETDEILAILPVLRRLGVTLIGVTGRPSSTLGQAADEVLDLPVAREACPHNLAPTSSTTAMLALMDAVALTVMKARRFGPDDFALYHPAGALGRRLLLRVADLCRTGDRVATCSPDLALRDALFRITKAQAGLVLIVDGEGRFVGVVSDGDIRRALMTDAAALGRAIEGVMNRSPRTTSPDRLITEALEVMERHPPCAELPVLDDNQRPVGVLNLKDVVRAGIA